MFAHGILHGFHIICVLASVELRHVDDAAAQQFGNCFRRFIDEHTDSLNARREQLLQLCRFFGGYI